MSLKTFCIHWLMWLAGLLTGLAIHSADATVGYAAFVTCWVVVGMYCVGVLAGDKCLH